MSATVHRRTFITLLGGAAAAWLLAARAQQQPAMPAVGFLRSTTADGFAHLVAAFRRGLKEAGFVEGQNVAIEYHYADNQIDRLPALMADLIRRPVAVIVTNGIAAPAAKAATTVVPIVIVTGSDPVRDGLVASLNRPGGNVTGVAFFAQALVAKRIELLRELVPNASTIGILVNPNFPGTAAEVADGQAAARARGMELQIIQATNDDEVEAAFADMEKRRIDALVVSADIFFYSRRDRIVALAARHAVPVSTGGIKQ